MDQGQKTVNCRTKDNVLIAAPLNALTQSNTFNKMYADTNFELNEPSVEFPVPIIDSNVFLKVLEWCNAHIGLPEPVLQENPVTRERVWFKLTKEEKKFFEMSHSDIKLLLIAADYLDIKSLYLYSCQTVASIITGMSMDRICQFLELKNDMSGEEKEEIKKKNPWCLL